MEIPRGWHAHPSKWIRMIGLMLAASLVLAGCGRRPGAADGSAASPAPDAAPEVPEVPAPASETSWHLLTGAWEGATDGDVGETGEVLRLGWSETLTAARWTGEVPPPGFELEAEARRVDGSDFFFSVTFPVRRPDEHVTLVVGGWGGAVVGISSIDGLDASENETTTFRTFENGRWYRMRLESRPERLRFWIDDEPVVDFETADHELSLRPGPIDACLPFGLATWQTTGEVRGLRWRPLEPGGS